MTQPETIVSPLTTSAAVVVLSGRAHLRIRGAERAAFLHGLVTNDIKKLKPGAGCRAAWLTPKGKMLAHLTVLALEDSLAIDADPSLESRISELLQKYGPFSPVEIDNATGSETVLHLAGPDSPGVLSRLGVADLPAGDAAHTAATIQGVAVLLVSFSRGVSPGFDLRVPAAEGSRVLAALRTAGAVETPEGDLESARVEAGIPKWGHELDESVLPDEAGLNRTSISYTKGCYIGQETVARIKTYGHVNRQLVQFRLLPESQIEARAQILSGGEPAGKVTSVAVCLDRSSLLALGYVKRELNVEGTEVEIQSASGPVTATVRTLPRPEAGS